MKMKYLVLPTSEVHFGFKQNFGFILNAKCKCSFPLLVGMNAPRLLDSRYLVVFAGHREQKLPALQTSPEL